ncbi:tissue-type plasminogen activator [Gadus morhua]|uniref:trypsin n=1 Tax=Gadus morhua TaxID=8049 RepID=A0A8C5FMV9_GADMO|nr:tissue-type plasminogen activator-like [Gadus morhua]
MRNMKLLVILVFIVVSIDEVNSLRRSERQKAQRTGKMCVTGDGSNYRGTVSTSARGLRCLDWDLFSSWKHYHPSKGLGPHNHCRNPNNSLKPWCRVRRGGRIIREFCGVHKCMPETAPVTTIQPKASVDTERTCGERTERRSNRVVGGVVAPIQTHPWVTAIYLPGGSFLCGGTLIAPCWVLTAAHCFRDSDYTPGDQLSVYLGKSALNETDAEKEQRFTVEQLVIHAEYRSGGVDFENDIALLRIRGSDGACAARTDWTRTACLAPLHTKLPAGMRCTVTGYGREVEGGRYNSQYLREAKVQLLSQGECRSNYAEKLTDNMLCAASPDWSRDACQGDSGGPLVCETGGRAFLYGVVSWGDGCAQRNKPGVYTRLTNYNGWIAKQTGLPSYTDGAMYPKK